MGDVLDHMECRFKLGGAERNSLYGGAGEVAKMWIRSEFGPFQISLFWFVPRE